MANDAAFISSMDSLSASCHVSPGISDHAYNVQFCANIKAYVESFTYSGTATAVQTGVGTAPVTVTAT